MGSPSPWGESQSAAEPYSTGAVASGLHAIARRRCGRGRSYHHMSARFTWWPVASGLLGNKAKFLWWRRGAHLVSKPERDHLRRLCDDFCMSSWEDRPHNLDGPDR